MKIAQITKILLLPSVVLLHTALIFLRGYFLSTEFTLYPYLTANGLLPYKDLIDQHFPVLFFGPISLPYVLSTNPYPLLVVFLSVLVITDILLFLSLEKYKVPKPFIWTVLFILTSVYFSGYILWVETFVNLLLSLFLYFSTSKRKLYLFFVGIALSQIVLLRPTALPGLLLLLLSLNYPISPLVLVGGSLGIIIPLLHLLKNNLINDFYNLAFIFNSQVYPKLATLLPVKREILKLITFSVTPVFYLVKEKKFLHLITLLCFTFLSFPRFGFEHLQPFFLLSIFFWAITVKKIHLLVPILIIILFLLNLTSAAKYHYGNFFLSPEIRMTGETLKEVPEKYVYIFGAPDLLYPLADKLPPLSTYLPSLPWYHQTPQFSQRIINNLMQAKPPILVDDKSSIDGRKLIDNNPIWEYIKTNYSPAEKIGVYILYRPNK